MAIIIILLTTSIGQPIILYIAALGNVDKSLVEAARVDGATEFNVFWKIKWSSLLPTTLYIVVITTINSFQCFVTDPAVDIRWTELFYKYDHVLSV